MMPATLTPFDAHHELARLGYFLPPDLDCLGAEMRLGIMIFRFRLAQPAGSDAPTWELDRDSLPCLLATTAWINRPEPVFDLAQMSLTDPQAWRELQRLRREDHLAYDRLIHPGHE